jgi:eukaryotic-like serine/threonine-protein kinase
MVAANVLPVPTGKAGKALSLEPPPSIASSPPSSGVPKRLGAFPIGARNVAEDAPTQAAPAVESNLEGAMLRAEAVRARSFARVAVVLSTLGLAFLWIEGAEGCLREETAVALVALIAMATVLWVRASPERGSSRALIRAFGLVALVESFVLELHEGPFSPYTGVIVLGLSFFGMGEARRAIIAYCGIAIGAHLGASLLVTFGVFRDAGVFSSEGMPFTVRLFVSLMTTAIYVVALVQARLSRKATADAMERAMIAARDAAHKQAQLDEAKAQLDRVLAAGAGRRGHWTGSRAGEYELAELVGRGAMGEVYAARDRRDGSRVAVKLLTSGADAGQAALRRFVREAQVAANLHAPNLVEVKDLGRTRDGTPFLAMELLAGHDLAWHLRRHARMPPEDVVTLVQELARGLTVAHALGIVHRDLKPQNVFLAEGAADGARWKVLDFGVCSLAESAAALTAAGDFVGTPGYLAPEQALGKTTDLRADVFALGAVAYRALTGLPAFPGSSAEALYRTLHEDPTRASDIVTDLPHAVDAVLARAMAKSPADRYSGVLELAMSLRTAATPRAELKKDASTEPSQAARSR